MSEQTPKPTLTIKIPDYIPEPQPILCRHKQREVQCVICKYLRLESDATLRALYKDEEAKLWECCKNSTFG